MSTRYSIMFVSLTRIIWWNKFIFFKAPLIRQNNLGSPPPPCCDFFSRPPLIFLQAPWPIINERSLTWQSKIHELSISTKKRSLKPPAWEYFSISIYGRKHQPHCFAQRFVYEPRVTQEHDFSKVSLPGSQKFFPHSTKISSWTCWHVGVEIPSVFWPHIIASAN